MMNMQLGRSGRVLAGLVAVAGGVASAQATPIIGLSLGGDRLVSFNVPTPGTLNSNVAISGLQASESLLAIDVRPATAQVYGVSNQNRLYTINPATGAATLVSQPGAAPFALSGSVGIDFNPVADRLRVTTSTGQNLRINPITGGLAANDSATNGLIRYDASDANAGTTPRVVSVAYTKSTVGSPAPASTTMYALDVQNSLIRSLATQGSIGGTPVSPNSGLLFGSKGVAGLFAGDAFGFDIETVGGIDNAYLSGQTAIGTTAFYSLDLANGGLAFWGMIGDGSLQIRDIAAIPAPGAAMLGVSGLAFAARRRR